MGRGAWWQWWRWRRTMMMRPMQQWQSPWSPETTMTICVFDNGNCRIVNCWPYHWFQHQVPIIHCHWLCHFPWGWWGHSGQHQVGLQWQGEGSGRGRGGSGSSCGNGGGGSGGGSIYGEGFCAGNVLDQVHPASGSSSSSSSLSLLFLSSSSLSSLSDSLPSL